jgi:hypothetical protein
MTSRPRFFAALFVMLFAGLEIAAPLPVFHRQEDELATLAAAHLNRGPTRVSAPAPRRGSNSHECPACVICGLSAILASGPVVRAPVPLAHRLRAPGVCLRAAPAGSHFRSRAPPSV